MADQNYNEDHFALYLNLCVVFFILKHSLLVIYVFQSNNFDF